MTASTAPSASAGSGGPTLVRLARSEWIKLRTLRSTVWCAAIILALSVGLSALLGGFLRVSGHVGAEETQSLGVIAATGSLQFTALVAAVLGALVITGEYGTGMIRSTFAAAPRRLPALVAKGAVVTLATFVVGAVSLLLSLAVAVPLLSTHGLHVDLGDGRLWRGLLGGAVYLGLIAAFAYGIGMIIRNSAGSIATAIGILFVLPLVGGILASTTRAAWISNAVQFLPSNAGALLSRYPTGSTATTAAVPGTFELTAWQGGLVVLGWVIVVVVIGAVLARRRDV